MPRPTQIHINPTALLHNVRQIKKQAPYAKLVAVVKCHAYGCGIENIIPHLIGHVDKLAVASIEEALAIRRLGISLPILILQGVFDPQDWQLATENNLECVLHNSHQLAWLIKAPLSKPIKIWIKINTGMNRLGFKQTDIEDVLNQLSACKWVNSDLILMSHFANADLPFNTLHSAQQAFFDKFKQKFNGYPLSFNNSAAIFKSPLTQGDYIRPGLTLYGVSPFENQTGSDLNLRPVMSLVSKVTHLFSINKGDAVGYGATWVAEGPTRIAIIPVGYGDGFPRHIQPNTCILIDGILSPVVGRVSMDVLTADVSHHPSVTVGSPVELWGEKLPIETIAHSAGTIPYELLVQVNKRSE